MPHFFIPPQNITGTKFTLQGTEAHHLVKVRRVKSGEELRLFDGTGKTYLARIDNILKNEITGTILKQEKTPQVKVKLKIFQSVPKGERCDWLIEKLSELGVNCFVPMITERSAVKQVQPAKIDRWRRLSIAATKQCSRPDIMEVQGPVDFRQAVESVKNPAAKSGSAKKCVSLIPWESEQTCSIKDALSQKFTECIIFIGPEGGFTAREIKLAVDAGIIPVTLGPRILRTETAGLLSVILALNIFDEFNNK